jgi:ATP-dependent Clp protease ATP-binding subunit ClpC
MFERFTDRARRVIVLARQEARALDHDWIGTEHILLGLLHESGGVAARALTAMGIGLDAMREAVEDIIPRGPEPLPESGHIPFTPRAKKVLELSLREAQQLRSDHIGTEHILLALVREGDGVAAQVLVSSGVDLNRARAQVITLLHGYHAEAGVSLAADPGGDDLLGRLASIAARLTAIELRLRQSSSG